MSHNKVILLLGSNLGDRKKNIDKAMAKIENEIGVVLKTTEVIETKPVEFASLNNFYNFATLIESQLSPIKLLKAIKKIEKELGREADTKLTGKYADRIIDIDIVYYSNLIFTSKILDIPHKKHVYEREFSKKLIEKIHN